MTLRIIKTASPKLTTRTTIPLAGSFRCLLDTGIHSLSLHSIPQPLEGSKRQHH